MSTLLIGYDVEAPPRYSHETRQFLARAVELHTALGAPCSFFAVGRTLEHNVDAFKPAAARPDIFDIQSHTYSHCLLKTVCQDDGKAITVFRGGSLDRVRRDVRRGLQVLKDTLGIEAQGLTTPYGYYRGLSDRPDLLGLLHRLGIRFVRSYARDEHDWQPLSLSIQPFWYAPQGYPDIFEFPVHGWQDCLWRAERGWQNVDEFRDYQCSLVDEAIEKNCVLSLAYHDWSSIREDPQLTIISGLLAHARKRGMRILSYRQYYVEQLGLH